MSGKSQEEHGLRPSGVHCRWDLACAPGPRPRDTQVIVLRARTAPETGPTPDGSLQTPPPIARKPFFFDFKWFPLVSTMFANRDNLRCHPLGEPPNPRAALARHRDSGPPRGLSLVIGGMGDCLQSPGPLRPRLQKGIWDPTYGQQAVCTAGWDSARQVYTSAGSSAESARMGGLKGMLILADGSCPLAVSWTLNDSRLARVGNTASTTHTSASCARKSTASVLCTPLTSPSHANALLLEAALQQSPGLVGHGVRESLLRRQSRRRRRRFRGSASPLWQSQCRRRRFKELLSPLQPQRGR